MRVILLCIIKCVKHYINTIKINKVIIFYCTQFSIFVNCNNVNDYNIIAMA